MKKILVAIMAGCVWFQIQAAELNWGTSVPKALASAKADHKLVLLDFTGSDWCGWCMKFDKETLSTEKFADYAKAHLELVVLDFPSKRAQSSDLKFANNKLKEQYGVDGFPTLILLNADGKELWRQVGYLSGGPDAFIAKLKAAGK